MWLKWLGGMLVAAATAQAPETPLWVVADEEFATHVARLTVGVREVRRVAAEDSEPLPASVVRGAATALRGPAADDLTTLLWSERLANQGLVVRHAAPASRRADDCPLARTLALHATLTQLFPAERAQLDHNLRRELARLRLVVPDATVRR